MSARCTDYKSTCQPRACSLHKIWDEQGRGRAAMQQTVSVDITQPDHTKNCHIDEKSALPTIFPNHFNHLGTSATGMRFKLNTCASSLT